MFQTEAWNEFKRSWIGDTGAAGIALPSYNAHPLISVTSAMSNAIIAVIDMKAMRYTYLSPDFGEYLGRTTEEFSNGGVEFAFSIIHPDDCDGVLAFSRLINGYFQCLPDEKKQHYSSFWDFRLQAADGTYVKMIQRDRVLRYDNEGRIEEFLLFASRIDAFISCSDQHLRMTDGDENLFYKFDHAAKQIIKLSPLSKRELEIARLIAQSMSLKEIAQHLNISFNTVKVHSANMMSRVGVNDSIELINLLRVWSFI